MILAHHYSHKTTKNRFASFLVTSASLDEANPDKTFHNKLGAIQLGYGIRPKMKHTVSSSITSDNYCEFDRMWLDDALPKNSESRVIGLLLSYIKTKWPQIHFIITYADGSVGNVGTIYKATNAILIGKTVVDFYILPPTEEYPDGERVHPVSLWHRHKTRKKEVLEKLHPGYTRVKGTSRAGPFQYKFLYVLHRGTRKAYEKEMQERRDKAELDKTRLDKASQQHAGEDSRVSRGASGSEGQVQLPAPASIEDSSLDTT